MEACIIACCLRSSDHCVSWTVKVKHRTQKTHTGITFLINFLIQISSISQISCSNSTEMPPKPTDGPPIP